MEKAQIVVKVSDTLATKLQELSPEVRENLDKLAAKMPPFAGLCSSIPAIRRMIQAAAGAERHALEDRIIRETLARYGLTPDSHRMSILTALWVESIVSVEETRRLFEFTLEVDL